MLCPNMRTWERVLRPGFPGGRGRRTSRPVTNDHQTWAQRSPSKMGVLICDHKKIIEIHVGFIHVFLIFFDYLGAPLLIFRWFDSC